MPKFLVYVTRNLTETAAASVEAANEFEAEALALSLADNLDFEIDDTSIAAGDCYVTGCESEE